MDEGQRNELLEIILQAATEARTRVPPRTVVRYRIPYWAVLLIFAEAGIILAIGILVADLLTDFLR